ncbi:hypothetical protein F4776DRAFT_310497 [Hypoxylon sp. NC0597]|nr:hypothetical protein F4776DRAFT_310497 [Hypoxylon sp. NC0597]
MHFLAFNAVSHYTPHKGTSLTQFGAVWPYVHVTCCNASSFSNHVRYNHIGTIYAWSSYGVRTLTEDRLRVHIREDHCSVEHVNVDEDDYTVRRGLVAKRLTRRFRTSRVAATFTPTTHHKSMIQTTTLEVKSTQTIMTSFVERWSSRMCICRRSSVIVRTSQLDQA